MLQKRHIIAIDFVIVIVSLFVIVGLIGFTRPLVIAPLENNDVLFSFSSAEHILIDDNLQFSSPEYYFPGDGAIIVLEEGVYYIKAVDKSESEIRELKVETPLELTLERNPDDSVSVINAGFDVSVESYEQGNLVSTYDVEGLE